MDIGAIDLYTYEALRAWAAEHGIEPRPELTAREFCMELAQSRPEINSELNELSFLYIRTAYGMEQTENQNWNRSKNCGDIFILPLRAWRKPLRSQA